MKAITTVLGGMLALFTATSAMAQTAQDDAVCRQWASQNANWAQAQANNNTVGSAFGGALLGAGIGAIAGGGRGAAIGAGAGAFTGAVAGGARAQGAGNQAWGNAYNYCMSTRRPAPRTTRQLNQWELQQWR
jgi:outer membrane lipoprotein SlyB